MTFIIFFLSNISKSENVIVRYVMLQKETEKSWEEDSKLQWYG